MNRDLFTGALVDLFAGGGGASGAMQAAHGRPVRMTVNLARPAADPDAVDASDWLVGRVSSLAPEANDIAEAVADCPSKRRRVEILRRAIARGADPEAVRDEWPSCWPRDGLLSTDRRFCRDVADARSGRVVGGIGRPRANLAPSRARRAA